MLGRYHLPPPSGITNHDEYSLVRELMEEKKEEVTGTLRKDKTLLRDEKKMEKLKQKLHTDDECKSGKRGYVVNQVLSLAAPTVPLRVAQLSTSPHT